MTDTNTAPVATPSGFTYTPEILQEMRDASPLNNDSCAALAEKFGFTTASVRAKAVRMQRADDGVVYQSKERTAKDGSAVESKADIVSDIAGLIDSDAESLESLGNATKLALKAVRDALSA